MQDMSQSFQPFPRVGESIRPSAAKQIGGVVPMAWLELAETIHNSITIP